MNCHYVPQFYLRKFEISGAPGYIYGYRRKEKVIKRTIRSVAAENDLYVFTDKFTGKRNDDIEKMFSWLEGLAAPVIEKINNGTSLLSLTNKEHNILAEFIAYLHTRNLGYREKQKSLAGAFLQLTLKSLVQDEKQFKKALREMGNGTKEADKIKKYVLNFDKYFKTDWGKKNDDYFLKQALELAIEIGPIMFYKEWHILDNQTSRLFITSDNPVVMMRPRSLPRFYGLGIANSHIVLPISPNKALLLLNKTKPSTDAKVISVDKKFVTSLNRHTMFYAHRFIFSNFVSKDIEKEFNMTTDGLSEKIQVN